MDALNDVGEAVGFLADSAVRALGAAAHVNYELVSRFLLLLSYTLHVIQAVVSGFFLVSCQ